MREEREARSGIFPRGAARRPGWENGTSGRCDGGLQKERGLRNRQTFKQDISKATALQ